jgi:hypothetical protein
MNLNLPLSLYYETCDEDGMVEPYFTGDITDSEGRVICRADSEGKALALIGGFDDLLANIEALRARLAEVELETKKQKGIIFGERKFSEALCNDLRSRLAEVEAQRDMMKGALEKIADSRRYGECSRLLGEIRVCAREALSKLEEK